MTSRLVKKCTATNFMLSRDDILTIIQLNEEKLKALGVKRLDLFGSFAHNGQSAESDIDFLVEFLPEKKTFRNYMHLKFLLEEISGRAVDLVLPNAIKPVLKSSIFECVTHVADF